DGDIHQVPELCLTQGLGTIMEARQLILIATGAGKAEAVRQLIEGDVSPEWPATVMQSHANALVLIDEAAASLLSNICVSCGQISVKVGS
ncbi:MAG: 6-phosphogluconolactonase, partial [Promicromonosporaceae bacterium]|nr:6-phosphogluconolactonase [Promicromonosporaceae bacterium]